MVDRERVEKMRVVRKDHVERRTGRGGRMVDREKKTILKGGYGLGGEL